MLVRVMATFGIIGEAESVGGALVGEQFSPPQSGLYANAWYVAKLVDGGLGGTGIEGVSIVEIERRVGHVPGRPANFTAPFSRYGFEVRVGGVPVLHING